MTTLTLADLTEAEREKLAALPIARLPVERLFHDDGRELSDATMDVRVDEALRQALRRQSSAGYQAAVLDELLQQPEAIA